MYYFRIERLQHSSRAAEVYFATFVLKSCGFPSWGCESVLCITFVMNVLKTAPRKFRDGVRESFFSREDGGFRNKEFQTTVMYIYIYIFLHTYQTKPYHTENACSAGGRLLSLGVPVHPVYSGDGAERVRAKKCQRKKTHVDESQFIVRGVFPSK